METVLFLCHRIPFPPNKGDKIATYHRLKYLNERYNVVLGCFIDDANDFQYIPNVEALCDELHVVDLCNKSNVLTGIASLLKAKPVSTFFHESDSMQNWVDDVVKRKGIERLYAYSASASQFIEDEQYASHKRVLDMTDVDSDKWRQYAQKKPFYSSWIYSRESNLLSRYEQQILSKFDAVTLVTAEERDLFKQMSPPSQHEKIYTLENGVDTEYFDITASYDETDKPSPEHEFICFTGAMDYWANVDAVVWFAENVWPELRAQNPNLYFYIVGGNPSSAVSALANIEGIVVTGRVVDVRPFVARSLLCVAPLRIARGVQNKILEAMSMSKPVVMTSMGQEGIELPEEQLPFVLDEPSQQVDAIMALINDEDARDKLGNKNRNWILSRYSWNSALTFLSELLERNRNNEK